MPVLLHTSVDLPTPDRWDFWAAITGTTIPLCLAQERRVPEESRFLHEALQVATTYWYDLARAMVPGSFLGHAGTVSTNACDLGLMLAWANLSRQWAAERTRTLIVCDDPWMFRHLRSLPGVSAGSAPGLAFPLVTGWLRGLAARGAVALRMVRAALRLKSHRALAVPGRSTLLVYGHPASTAQGQDAYFGDLILRLPDLARALHVDCPEPRAKTLAEQGRAFSLHAFGHPAYALVLPFVTWKAPRALKLGPDGWLIRRAERREAATGTAAMIAWQIHCQGRWLRRARPKVVAWPWENHGWERALVNQSRTLGIRSLGYQHSVIGSQGNFSARGLADPQTELPDLIVANGPSGRDQMLAGGLPESRVVVGGALRFKPKVVVRHDPDGPIFVAVPFDGRVASQMLQSIRPLAAEGWHFLVKDHPLSPFEFEECPGITRTNVPLEDHVAVKAVLYSATTVGLEASLAGLPVVCFLPSDCVAHDILPKEIHVRSAAAENLRSALLATDPLPPVSWDSIFSRPRLEFWKNVLGESV